jgi:hypothetical protein
MKSTIDQISFNAMYLTYTMFLSIEGNNYRINISHSEAEALIKDGLRHSKVSIECNNDITYWIFD